MDEKTNVIKAIWAVNHSQIAYCKFLSANDTGDTGGHQAGIYIAKNAFPILFDEPGKKGENKERFVKICWQDDFETDSRLIYYGRGTRDEYRITRFNRGFPFLCTEHTGDLFVFAKMSDDDYSGYILSTDDEIDEFLNTFGMGPSDTGRVIEKEEIRPESELDLALSRFVESLEVDFPSSSEMSANARRIYYEIFDNKGNIIVDPDKEILSWIDVEFKLFRMIEFIRYGDMITKGFGSVEEFIKVANMVLNRRKSRAGKSLEHHLSAVFDENALRYAFQPTTEGNKQPDFIFPDESSYHNKAYPSDKLVFLGAKTTCKDRWRQVINEADRIAEKHLFTLQQGISVQQLKEMETEKVILVVPRPYIYTFPKEKHDSIWTLKKFIEFAKEKACD